MGAVSPRAHQAGSRWLAHEGKALRWWDARRPRCGDIAEQARIRGIDDGAMARGDARRSACGQPHGDRGAVMGIGDSR
jgi:hypothetical protein